MRRFLLGLIIALSLVISASDSAANDVLPRLLTNVPINMNFVGFGYTHSTGNVAVDPALALDVESELDTFVLRYTRSFAAFGQSATFSAVLPYSDLQLTGIVQGERVTARDDRMGDPRFRLALNLAGAPALELSEFAGYRQKTLIGFSLEVTPPLGHYDETRRVNFGSNRWTVSPELGIGRRFERFTLEAAASAIFFSDNEDYLATQTLKQEPIGVVRANLIFHFRRPGTWVGFSTLYLRGGETTIDGEDREDLQENTRFGVALSVPFARRHNLLFKFSSGVTTRIGADFDNYSVAYSYMF